jgi:hypothetical protein
MQESQEQEVVLTTSLMSAARATESVSGFTHEFYRYPARFSPLFARSVIQEFTIAGDYVYDPFMGGATTLVEAVAAGRNAIGTDISALSVFIGRVKTRLYSKPCLKSLNQWARTTAREIDISSNVSRPREWIEAGYQRNLDTPDTWRIRKLIEQSIERVGPLRSAEQRDFARCGILKTAQWALDCREKIPTVADFRRTLLENVERMIEGAEAFAAAARHARGERGETAHAAALHRSAEGVETDKRFQRYPAPRLILTSPPYPGVHVLYHRWQIRGRRETPAPFWIANKLDGLGSSYYTFGDRRQEQLYAYFRKAEATFASLRRIANQRTLLVQMLAFSDIDWQLPRYLKAMYSAGWQEAKQQAGAEGMQRLWRSVPNRRWYAALQGQSDSGKEVVLFHRPRLEG